MLLRVTACCELTRGWWRWSNCLYRIIPEKTIPLWLVQTRAPLSCWLRGVERTDRENRKYLTPNTFLKRDGVDSPFSYALAQHPHFIYVIIWGQGWPSDDDSSSETQICWHHTHRDAWWALPSDGKWHTLRGLLSGFQRERQQEACWF